MSGKKDKEVAVVEAEAARVDPTANLPVDIQALMKKELEDQSKHIGALPTNKVGLMGKQFTLPDGQASDGPIEAIILDFAWSLVHYKGVYNSNNPQQPDCFAVGRDKPDSGLLVPHPSVEKPYASDCNTCPKNQWKSAATGKGKACKNQRRLIVVPPNFTSTTEPMTMYVSPNGLKNFDAYVSQLKNVHGLLPVQVVTEISFDKDQSYPLLKFKFLAPHPRVAEAWALKTQSESLLFREIETKAA